MAKLFIIHLDRKNNRLNNNLKTACPELALAKIFFSNKQFHIVNPKILKGDVKTYTLTRILDIILTVT